MENTDTIINIEKDDNECPICLISLNEHPQDIVHLKCCKKDLHIECYIRCMNQKKECPMCRNNNKIALTETIFPPIHLPLQEPLLSSPPQFRILIQNRLQMCRSFILPASIILSIMSVVSYYMNF